MRQRVGGQGGWVGLIVILLALAIVAWLAKDALQQYGMLSGPGKGAEPAGMQHRPPSATATESSGVATPSLPAPMERVRALEETVKRGAEAQSRQVDEATK